MEGISLVKGGGDNCGDGDSIDIDKCILCQEQTGEALSGTSNGRKRLQEAASIRKDFVSKRIRLAGDSDFLYHVTNDCYKSYTHQKSLDKLGGKRSQPDDDQSSSERLHKRRSDATRPPPVLHQVC